MLWLEKKRLWILDQGKDSIGLHKESLDAPNPLTTEFEYEERKCERPTKLF